LIEIHIDPSKVEDAYDISNDIEPEWDMVALETTDDCLISGIDRIFYRNDKYYVFDKTGKTVFLFDSTGKFISKLYKKGEGPDEYSAMDAVCIVDENIWVADGNMRWLICYDENMKMTERVRTFDIIGACDINYLNGNIYIADNWFGWNEKNAQLAQYNIQTKEITGVWFVPKVAGEETARWVKSSQLAQSGSSCLFTYSYCDTIFQIDDEGCTPKYRMIFSERYKDIPQPIEEYINPENSHIIKGIEDIKQTQNKIFIEYSEKRYLKSAIYDKNTNECKVYPWLVYPDLNDFEIYQTNIYFDDNNMICGYDAETFLTRFGKESDRAKIKNESYRKKIESIVSSIDEYSNHIIIKFKLKPDSKL
jgi:hypothetical protein